jgi:hypothetical protein
MRRDVGYKEKNLAHEWLEQSPGLVMPALEHQPENRVSWW